MELTVKDRLNMFNLFPPQGTLADQVMVKGIKSKIDFKNEETERIVLKVTGKNYGWDDTKAKNMDPEFTADEINFLRNRVDALDSAGDISLDMVDLCVKIQKT